MERHSKAGRKRREHVCCKYSGADQYCLKREEFGSANHDQGSYGSHVVWSAKNLHVLPDGLESSLAGPLLCGGATVWGALVTSGGRPVVAGDVVGVVGIGGLGHLAIQFAEKLGATVIAFSSTDSKREEALGFGASEFYATKGVTKFDEKLVKKIDHLLITTSELPDFDLYLPIIASLGVIHPLTVGFDKTPVPMLPVVVEGRSIQGSATAPHLQVQKMLEFSARFGVKPQTQEWPMTAEGIEGIEGALKTLADGQMRYRGVVVAQ
ncbi:putative formaldehyde dehydrogenase AdhA [Lipomyces tetrasporus]|uniref:Formaldehyde dehydrogenase AdhA n=1 Tax=Lipomyces tetrasporus TaxID=54092 RepID=A0AAD7VPG3_9ASCO|nr:putative formaldehyde dehydrogenase AdhA [Lipomyces tetrasporus]KAJ8096429.1 putative formaldehyde dehydrogenase AdhA [Lipomyces tetrasporus]